MRDKPRKIKHCEIYKQSTDTTSFLHRRTIFISLRSAADSRTEQVSFNLSFNFHLHLQIRVWFPCDNDENLVMGAGHVTKRWIGALIPEMSAHFNRSFETSKSTRDCLRANNAEYFNEDLLNSLLTTLNNFIVCRLQALPEINFQLISSV